MLVGVSEAWLAEHFNAYLADPDEHRAILHHLGGRVDYGPPASPSPWTGPTAPESPTRSSCSPTNSTPPRRAYPAIADH